MICFEWRRMPRPHLSTPQLFDTTMRSFFPDSFTASIVAMGIPHSPNPPTRSVAPSCKPAATSAADAEGNTFGDVREGEEERPHMDRREADEAMKGEDGPTTMDDGRDGLVRFMVMIGHDRSTRRTRDRPTAHGRDRRDSMATWNAVRWWVCVWV